MKVITLEQAINEIKRLYNDECIPCSTSHTICEDLRYELKEFDAIPLDKVKEAREEIIDTNDSTLAIVEVLDRLIAESEG